MRTSTRVTSSSRGGNSSCFIIIEVVFLFAVELCIDAFLNSLAQVALMLSRRNGSRSRYGYESKTATSAATTKVATKTTKTVTKLMLMLMMEEKRKKKKKTRVSWKKERRKREKMMKEEK